MQVVGRRQSDCGADKMSVLHLPTLPSMYSSDLVLANGRAIDPTLLQTWVTTSARPDFGVPGAESLQPTARPDRRTCFPNEPQVSDTD